MKNMKQVAHIIKKHDKPKRSIDERPEQNIYHKTYMHLLSFDQEIKRLIDHKLGSKFSLNSSICMGINTTTRAINQGFPTVKLDKFLIYMLRKYIFMAYVQNERFNSKFELQRNIYNKSRDQYHNYLPAFEVTPLHHTHRS